MDNNSTNDRTEMEKLLADLDTVDFDSLDQDFRGVTVDEEQWRKYQMIVKELLTIRDIGQGVSKVLYAEAPDPLTEYASAMLVLDTLSALNGDAKAAFATAASLCDSITITTSGGKVRASFAIDHIWKDGGM